MMATKAEVSGVHARFELPSTTPTSSTLCITALGECSVACLALALRAINGGHKIVIIGDS